MFAGHIGVALAAARVEPRVNVGAFAAASLLLDLLLWLFILLGWESVAIGADFAQTHQPAFVFPYSHGLLASIAWSAAAGAIVYGSSRCGAGGQARAALLFAGVVFSHWLLDALVHRPELPIAGAASPQVGFGLWDAMSVALAVEAGLLVLGALLFIPGCGASRPKKIALAALGLAVLAFTVLGMTVAPPPPSATAMAASSLVAIVLVCALVGWLGRDAPGAPGPGTG